MQTQADGVEDWLASMGPLGVVAGLVALLGVIGVGIKMMIQAGRQI